MALYLQTKRSASHFRGGGQKQVYIDHSRRLDILERAWVAWQARASCTVGPRRSVLRAVRQCLSVTQCPRVVYACTDGRKRKEYKYVVRKRTRLPSGELAPIALLSLGGVPPCPPRAFLLVLRQRASYTTSYSVDLNGIPSDPAHNDRSRSHIARSWPEGFRPLVFPPLLRPLWRGTLSSTLRENCSTLAS